MKKVFTVFFILIAVSLNAQQGGIPPFMANPDLPAFYLLKPDNKTWITPANLRPGVPVMMMLFSPECDHCQQQTDQIVKNIKKFSGMDIVMTTYEPMPKIDWFAKKYQLSKYPNIHIARDTKYTFVPFYRPTKAPFIAIYDKKRKIHKAYDGGAPVEKILGELPR